MVGNWLDLFFFKNLKLSKVDEEMVIIIMLWIMYHFVMLETNLLFKLVSHLVLRLCGWWPFLPSSGTSCYGWCIILSCWKQPTIQASFTPSARTLWVMDDLLTSSGLRFLLEHIYKFSLHWFFLHRIHSHMAKVSSAYGLVMMATNISRIPQCFVLLDLLLSSSMKFFFVFFSNTFFYNCFLCICFVYNSCIHAPFYKFFF